ncbi:MAG: hypothetical protein PHX24_04925 [Acidithiobacillus sp.]|nr:hypothetical protein [Acidithiobacillus sp.]
MFFEETVVELLKGSFICSAAYPELFAYLEDEKNRERVDIHLTPIGRRLHVTKNQHAYYAIYKTIRPEHRGSISKLFQDIKNEIQPVLKFLNMVIQAQRAEAYLEAEDVLDFSQLLFQIGENPNLEEILRQFPNLGKEFTASEASLRAILDRVMTYLVHKGYMVKEQQGDRYRVTGKIDYYYEIIDFIIENDTVIQGAQGIDAADPENLGLDATGTTGRLL